MINKNSSKAKVLKQLVNKISLFKIPPLIYFSCSKYLNNHEKILVEIKNVFNKNLIIVRSSSLSEDSENESAAGMYDSILDVKSSDPVAVDIAINAVINSYKKNNFYNKNDQIIVQRMIKSTSMSGVIFTHDLNTGAPYYVINYDDQSGFTDTVTSGNGQYSNRTLYIHRNSIDKLRSERFIKLLQAVKELEIQMSSEFLDIEFALGNDLTPYLLQVRSITTKPNWNRGVVKKIDTTLLGVKEFVSERFKKINNLHGKFTILGQMPDWNPAEMLGRAPRALATSFYQALITDYAWVDAREQMGYSVPKGQPLMVTLAGQPFIDVRLSFNSFLPNGTPSRVSEKLVNHWLNHLKESPELHDKVEFDVAITCYSFDIDKKIALLIGDKLSNSEKNNFKKLHLNHTREMITGYGNSSLKRALDKISMLKSIQDLKSNSNKEETISVLFSMISECVEYGTIPFSILARHGFIAKSMLLSLQNLGIITKHEVNQFQGSIQTVASDLVDDMWSLQEEKINISEFMKSYGHLRPGTYDIMSHRYDQMIDVFNGDSQPSKKDKINQFNFSKKQHQQVDELLLNDDFGDFKADDLLDYMREAIIGREYGKFIFTRSISDMLELIANFAQKNGLSRDEISHIPLNEILNIAKSSQEVSLEEKLRNIAIKEKEKHHVSIAVRLPQLLIDEESVHIVPFQVSHPNFITHQKIIAQCVVLHSEVIDTSLNGKVVVIEGADPGFDWIFTQNIAGLITKYGGANSHMAIRCAEFGIPAAIGCGEQSFELLLKSNKVHLDCAAGLINPLH
ncbi:PEP-utilizing enzyme [Candidatus Thioglobus sp.]|nr:PEP-utilizing enzyme [Candidatus Thioglobus sp.]